MSKITYFIGTDHAGYKLKAFVIAFLQERGFKVVDLAPQSENRVDYPDFAQKVCEAIDLESSRGILICGSGIGMSIAANRYKHIRAALCTDAYMAKMARAHNNANVLCMGERISGVGEVESILEAFISTEFEGGRHLMRVEKLGILR
ncbi:MULTISPECIES: ribose 5-phosphate isomerase B [Helicobacter]|uniref:Ribose 5-phosphate isomerase B n=3 Tax=Helicobacter typhlonius TaxID=76936 RepID=A0A0S4PXC8_9HELI|nr:MULTISPECIES: ribose 5-phosphate isomerase B [Helicobacter]TLD78663.1 ribose 5-phosphate isomerase B [Helicobacter typhlonius]TLD89452.1 ribose 5-phosphate isomerase B [Helicobacter sp. MIT 03-1616]CUU40068.1 Ribose 5-phosphate isomerase B [Helicobacter typhlonius]